MSWVLRYRWRFGPATANENKRESAGNDSGVGDVENRPPSEIYEVYDCAIMIPKDPINNVANRTTQDETDPADGSGRQTLSFDH